MFFLIFSFAFALAVDFPMPSLADANGLQPGAQAALQECFNTVNSGYISYRQLNYANATAIQAKYQASVAETSTTNAAGSVQGAMGSDAQAGLESQLAQFQAIKNQCMTVCTKSQATLNAPPPQPVPPQYAEAKAQNIALMKKLMMACQSIAAVNIAETASGLSNMMMVQMGASAVQGLSKAFNSSSGNNDSSSASTTNSTSIPSAASVVPSTGGSNSNQTAGFTAPAVTNPASTASTSSTSEVANTQTAAALTPASAKSSFSTASATPMTGAICLQQISGGRPLLNSSQCLQGLQRSCDGNTTSVCQNFTNFYCSQGSYDSSLVSGSGTIAAGGGVMSSYTMSSAILSAHGLVNLNYCQRQSARGFCTYANLNCLSCKSLYGRMQISVSDVLNAKGSCFKDPVYQAGVYDVLVGALPH